MSSCCKECECVQSKLSGNAPERPCFEKPTYYDHMPNFQKYKKGKEEEENIKVRKEELTKFDSNFTDWQPLSRGEFDLLSTQEIAQFRREVRNRNTGNFDVASIDDGETASSANTSKAFTKKDSLLTISRTPVMCPIGACERTIGVTSVLSHYLRDHSEDYGVQCQEIIIGKRSVLIYDPNTLEFRDNVCLGVLAYGGRDERRESHPAERGICMHNAFLPKTHERLEAHLPILIMTCKTSWSAIIEDKEIESQLTDPAKKDQHMLVIWLVSVQTTKPIHCTVTVFDQSMTSSRSKIMRVRHLNEPQNPSEFLYTDTNYLRLSRGEIDILTHGNGYCINMEVMINEYEQ